MTASSNDAPSSTTAEGSPKCENLGATPVNHAPTISEIHPVKAALSANFDANTGNAPMTGIKGADALLPEAMIDSKLVDVLNNVQQRHNAAEFLVNTDPAAVVHHCSNFIDHLTDTKATASSKCITTGVPPNLALFNVVQSHIKLFKNMVNEIQNPTSTCLVLPRC